MLKKVFPIFDKKTFQKMFVLCFSIDLYNEKSCLS